MLQRSVQLIANGILCNQLSLKSGGHFSKTDNYIYPYNPKEKYQ